MKNKTKNWWLLWIFPLACRMPSAWFIALNKCKEEGGDEETAVERRCEWEPLQVFREGAQMERAMRKEAERKRRGGVLNWEGGASSRVVRLRSCLPSTEVYLKYLGTKWITVVYLQAADKQPGSFSGQSDLHQGLRASPLTWPAGWPGSPRTAGRGVLPVFHWEPFNCASFSRLLSYSAAGSRQHFLFSFLLPPARRDKHEVFVCRPRNFPQELLSVALLMSGCGCIVWQSRPVSIFVLDSLIRSFRAARPQCHLFYYLTFILLGKSHWD